MDTDRVPRGNSNRALSVLGVFRVVGLAAGVSCLATALLGGAAAFQPPLTQLWFGAYVICLASMLAATVLVGTISNRHPEPPLRVWPYYLAVVGLLVLLILIAPFVFVANMRFL